MGGSVQLLLMLITAVRAQDNKFQVHLEIHELLMSHHYLLLEMCSSRVFLRHSGGSGLNPVVLESNLRAVVAVIMW